MQGVWHIGDVIWLAAWHGMVGIVDGMVWFVVWMAWHGGFMACMWHGMALTVLWSEFLHMAGWHGMAGWQVFIEANEQYWRVEGGGGEKSLACIKKCPGEDTDLLNSIRPDGIPDLLSNHAEELLVYLRDVEAFSLGKVVMLLSSDFGLVYDEDLLTVMSGMHWVELEVKIEVGKGLSVSWWPATKVHVS